MKLNDTEKNELIAKHLGWILKWQNQSGAPLLPDKPKGHCWPVWISPLPQYNADPDAECVPPNYFQDLNAMHKAEKLFTGGQKQSEYRHELSIELEAWGILSDTFAMIHAPASFRAEAFGRTLNLWES